MAQVPFPNVISQPGSYSYSSADLGLDTATTNDVEEGADTSTFVATGNDLIIVFASAAPLVLTITSVADALGRVATSAQDTYAIPSGETHIIGPLKKAGFADAGSLIEMQADAVDLRCCVVQIAQQ